MNDKQQLAAMGEHLAEQQPLCMAKRIEELEAQVRVMAGLLRELREGAEIHPHNCTVCKNADGIANWTSKLERIDATLAGNLPIHAEQHLAMVPGGDGSRDLFERWFRRDYHPDRQGPHIKDITWAAWQAALAAAPKPEGGA